MPTGSGCGSEVKRYIPKGWGHREITYKCGQTGVDGYPVLCTKCERGFDRAQFREEIEACGERIDDDY